MSKPEKPVLMAIIGRAHGTQGAVRVKSFMADPAALDAYGLLYDKTGRSYRVKSLRLQKTAVIAHFAGVDNRTAAEALNGTELFVDRAQLPDNLAEDEFYQDDLLGFTVLDADGGKIGSIVAFFNFGGGDIMEIAVNGGKNRLVPFTKAAVPHIDRAARQVVIDPVAAGFAPDDADGEQEA